MIAEKWEQLIDSFPALFRKLGDLCAECYRFFGVNAKGRAINLDFQAAFEKVLNVLDPLQILLDSVVSWCNSFDTEACRGNGYRSLVYVLWKCMQQLQEVVTGVKCSKEKLFFRSFHSYMEVNSYTEVLCRLFTMMQFAVMLMDMSKPGSLFPDFEKNEHELLELLQDFEAVNRESFYGRAFGFQFAPSLRQSLQVIGVAMAAYGDGFDKHDHSTYRAIYSFLHSGKYVVDPELRARRIVDLTKDVSVDFCKEFWSLPEKHGIQHVPSLICPTLEINREFTISVESLKLEDDDGNVIDPSIPLLNTKKDRQINVHLLSYFWREGQEKDTTTRKDFKDLQSSKPKQKSSNLIIHCHGGGFVAQSSKSHEIYLRHWAKELRAPILSINYSLSPDSVFPEALNECFYVYAWALKNSHLCGSTAERICFTGDSAGANLVTSLCLKAIQSNIRLPDGLAVAYPPFLVQYIPSPSRILSLMDPLLPLGILRECLEAYSGLLSKKETSSSKSLRKRRKLKTPFLGTNANPYHIDLGGGEGESIPLTKSYSDSNLLRTKKISELSRKNDLYKPAFFQDKIRTFSTNQGASAARVEFTPDFPDTGSIDSNYSGIQITIEDDSDFLPCSKCEKTISLKTGIVTSIASDRQLCKNCLELALENATQADTFPVLEALSSTMPGLEDVNSSGEKTAGRLNSLHRQRSRSESDLSILKRTLSRIDDNIKEDNEHDDDNDDQPQQDGEVEHGLARDKTENGTKEYNVHFKRSDNNCSIMDAETVNRKGSTTEEGRTLDGQTLSVEIPNRERRLTLTESLLHTPLHPLMSPLAAPDKWLKRLPQTKILASALDPLLDDSVAFTKRLEGLGNKVDLYIIEDLPHGFLQFSVISNEAKEACDLMVACMKEILGLGMHRVASQK